MGPKKFTIRLLHDPRQVAIQALSSAIAEGDVPQTACRTLRRLRDGVGRETKAEFELQEMVDLRAALATYAEAHLREGSPTHQHAMDLAHALGDIVDTAKVDLDHACRELIDTGSEPVPVATAAHRVSEEQMREHRDAMLREVFTGGPRKKVNIWGQVVDEPESGD